MIDRVTNTKLWEIRLYIDKTRVHHRCNPRLPSLKELLALGKFAQHEPLDATLLSFSYGWARGYREAKGLPLTVQHEPIPALSAEDQAIYAMVKSLDEVRLRALLTTTQMLAEGSEFVAALEAGNAVLVNAGRKPV